MRAQGTGWRNVGRAGGLPGLGLGLLMMALLAPVGCGETRVSDRDIEFVSVDDAFELSQGDTGLLGLGERDAAWVDPRSVRDFDEGHIPGAINVQIEEVRSDHPLLSQFDVFIVYGDDYNEPIALAMCKKLLANGYDDVRTLRGGLRAWTRQGNDLEGGDG